MQKFKSVNTKMLYNKADNIDIYNISIKEEMEAKNAK